MECMTPSLAQASIATTISKIIGMYMATLSPFFNPITKKVSIISQSDNVNSVIEIYYQDACQQLS